MIREKRISLLFFKVILLFALPGVVEASNPFAPFIGTGRLSANVAIFQAPVAEVNALLNDSRLELAPSPLTDRTHHPLVVMFGVQHNVHPLAAGIGLPGFLGPRYGEFIVLIPFVRKKGETGATYNHMPLLYLDSRRAVLAGLIYGYPKVFADITAIEESFRVFDRHTGATLVAAEAIGDSRQMQPPQTALDAMKIIFSNPFIQTRGDELVASLVDWRLSHARIIPARLAIALPAMKQLKSRSMEVPSLDEDGFGAFHLETTWLLSPPFNCADMLLRP